MPKQFDLWENNASKSRPDCRSWSRMYMDGLCKTITTAITPQCAFTGAWIHPEEDRLITVMEARRAQGLPDNEVLIGNASQAFKIVGNGVARSVAFVWGLAIRYAYLGETHILKR
jgi:DNA (cytosine-5)-methyltransferase 1